MTLGGILKKHPEATEQYPRAARPLALNISFNTLNRWENSRTTPSPLARMRLIEYYTGKGVSYEIVTALKRV